MKSAVLTLLTATAVLMLPGSASAATCSDYATQSDAQRAADTRDADGDGVYCESLPCPCTTGSTSTAPPLPPPVAPSRPPVHGDPGATRPSPRPASSVSGCVRTKLVQRLRFSSVRYPNIKAHTLAAIAKGWPRVMVLNRRGAPARRDRLLADIPTKTGFDRDEYPAAVGRGRPNGRQRGLVRGINPLGWMADVQYVPSSENRSHGSSLGAKLRRFCDGTRFAYVFVA